MVNVDIAALRSIEREKEISFDTLVAALETALLTAYKHTPHSMPHARVAVDRKTGQVIVWAQDIGENGDIIEIDLVNRKTGIGDRLEAGVERELQRRSVGRPPHLRLADAGYPNLLLGIALKHRDSPARREESRRLLDARSAPPPAARRAPPQAARRYC